MPPSFLLCDFASMAAIGGLLIITACMPTSCCTTFIHTLSSLALIIRSAVCRNRCELFHSKLFLVSRPASRKSSGTSVKEMAQHQPLCRVAVFLVFLRVWSFPVHWFVGMRGLRRLSLLWIPHYSDISF
mmetsp:Transcript_9016/g.31926  ORF Transcript_9016/g.31926 Transcript_9016/m.31926 type:complete len:129 (-) Transcript_9016:571-957(-)